MALAKPSPTLYVSNLETKTKKPELKASLYSLFTPYGQIIDIVAKKNGGGRGQAFIVFAEQAGATAALRGLSGEVFYNKELSISYAKTPSNATLSRQDPSLSRDKAAIEAAKLVVSNAQGEYEQLEKEREADEAALRGEKREASDVDGAADGDDQRDTKRLKGDSNAVAQEEEEEEMELDDDEDDDQPSLICSNLPPECNEDIMSALFSQYTGFVSVSSYTSSIPKSHPKPNGGARSFLIKFDSGEGLKKAEQETKGYLMQPGWEMGVSQK
ncbi:uncharacterized protein I303_103889 [Kwoniella dejecticola CBS 10117]|uniref:RRM domain-containing protein n=1 Tax=Kwoniella dejecticola CBS 10117 TaxID=1296121 RepID=A0A1A6A801_9TREE|nr:uncharacterized protein I303_03908 [Kwoniella dejecticola CBS 10117]OBR86188.1 hypothetical protein I303_03908 [Kwoniella dejecticola CBS 10117]